MVHLLCIQSCSYWFFLLLNSDYFHFQINSRVTNLIDTWLYEHIAVLLLS